ncbi:MAG TPA: HlyD family efflux transporter periplasmic adaptor subunit [Gammaproteobacteria bacterium]|nr:HlyD family efflux transporter periplasmic adaptor subunit [Gammaproteobacteria bacterium]
MTIRRLLPLFLALFFLSAILSVVYYKPEASKRGAEPAPVVSVETLTIEATDYRVIVNSFGRVEPHTQGQLISQVSGQIVSVSPNFHDGGFFARDEILVGIDSRDYLIQVEIAAAELADARVTYAEEQVLAKQAAEDRKNIVKKEAVSDFALHIPQLAAAKSRIAAAAAKLDQARLNVERTRIRAPYSGRILAKNVDIGEVVPANTSLARIYATDRVEIRLPIKNSELGFIELPEQYVSGETDGRSRTTAKIANRLLARISSTGPPRWSVPRAPSMNRANSSTLRPESSTPMRGTAAAAARLKSASMSARR